MTNTTSAQPAWRPSAFAAERPFAAEATLHPTVCGCHQAVADGRDLVHRLVSNSESSNDLVVEALGRSASIAWSGDAADLFRSRLAEIRLYGESMNDWGADTRALLG